VQVEGRIAADIARLYEFEAAASGAIRQNLDVAAFARETALPLRPLVVVQLDVPQAAPDGLRRQWMPAEPDVAKHHGYAAQWFALSALITGLYVWFRLIQPRRRPR
jgi:surfeit locus 1 family protein